MYRQIVDTFGGFHYGFADGWVGVHDAAEFVGGGFEGHGNAGFGEELCGVRADDVDAEDFVVFLFGDDLHKTVGFAEDAGLARSREREFADFYIVTFGFCFLFGQADTGDFGVAVSTVRDEALIYRLDLFAGDLFNDHDALFRRKMGKPGGVDNIADRENIRFAGFAVFVDLDRAARVYDNFSTL